MTENCQLQNSSVSPPPIEAEKNFNFQPINEILLFPDPIAQAYKGDESLADGNLSDEPTKQIE